MKVLDDCIPTAYQNSLEAFFLSDKFAWYYANNTVNNYSEGLIPDVKDSWQLCHILATPAGVNSEHFGFVLPLLYNITENAGFVLDEVLRAKANLVFSDSTNTALHKPPHTDIDQNAKYYTAIYYVNDSDGDTIFFSANTPINNVFKQTSKVSPKKGRAVLFDGHTYHAGQLPTLHKNRCVINFNFTVKS